MYILGERFIKKTYPDILTYISGTVDFSDPIVYGATGIPFFIRTEIKAIDLI